MVALTPGCCLKSNKWEECLFFLCCFFLFYLFFLLLFLNTFPSFLFFFVINDKRLKKWVIKETKVWETEKQTRELTTLLCPDLKSPTRSLPALLLKENLEHSALASALT